MLSTRRALVRPGLLLATPLFALTLAACGDDGDSGGAGSIKVEAGDDSCTADKTDLTAGKVTFDVKNVGGDVTEVYVYGKGSDGDYDRIIGEVENIAPSTSRDFPVSLSAGTYELACKPGQTGDGIRQTLTVTGEGGTSADESEAPYDEEVEVEASNYKLEGLEDFTAEVGERIEFKLQNNGTVEHELEIFAPDGDEIGEIEPVEPGEDGEVIVEFTEAGTYSYKCGIDGHAGKGMRGTFTVE